MTPQDAVFLAIAAALLLERPKYWWLACLAPLVAWGAIGLPLGGFHHLVVALIVCLPMLRFAPVTLLLSLPDYRDITSAAITVAVWLGALVLFESMDERFNGNTIPGPLNGAPIRLLTIGILYYVLLPVFYL